MTEAMMSSPVERMESAAATYEEIAGHQAAIWGSWTASGGPMPSGPSPAELRGRAAGIREALKFLTEEGAL